MDTELREALIGCETNVSEALERFAGDEELYLRCLDGFLMDQTMAELDAAIDAHAWDEAFTAAHAIKGVAGNMGFVPLFHSTAKLVVDIRKGRLGDIAVTYNEVMNNYKTLTLIIRMYRGVHVK